MLALTEPILKRVGLGFVKLTGDVPSAKRGDLIQKFFDDSECRVFLSTDAGGVGLNLQAASLVINLDLPWNPAVLEQRIARAHRHGQLSSVQVINLIAKGTIEERMLDTLSAKKNVFATVFGTDESPASIKFADMGPSLLQKLGDLLQTPVDVELALAPTEPAPVTGTETQPEQTEPVEAPTLKDFTSLLLDRIPNRIQLVRKAPHMPGATGEGIIIVVSGAPADLRPAIEAALSEHYRGLGSTIAAIVGGLILGVFQSLTSTYAGMGWAPVGRFMIFVAALIFVPGGIMSLFKKRRLGK